MSDRGPYELQQGGVLGSFVPDFGYLVDHRKDYVMTRGDEVILKLNHTKQQRVHSEEWFDSV